MYLTAADPMKESEAEAISLTLDPLLLQEAPERVIRALRKAAAGEATARIRNRKHRLHIREIPAAAQELKILIRRIRRALRMMIVLSEKVQGSCAQKDQSEQEEGTETHAVPFLYGFENQKIRCTSMDGGSVALCRNRFENDMKLEKNL